jgi:LCP family protein required for cell wall assembly
MPIIIKPKSRILNKLLTAFGVITLFLATFGGLYVYDRWQGQVQKVSQYTVDGELIKEACTNIVNPECWTEAFQPELLKENNKTAIMIIGSDARNNSSFIGNTDSLMLAVYDHGTKQLKTISFPRDLLAPYQYKEGGNTYYAKINSIYAVGSLYGENKDGLKVFKRTIEKITGEKIQYAVVVRFDGVIKGIDAIGGIDINVTEDHTDVYPKPELPDDLRNACVRPKLRDPNDHSLNNFCVFTFKKGMQHMDGMHALIYARMRELSTDFDRARRQQEVVNAVKDTILKKDASLAEKAENLINLYTGIKDYIDLKFDLDLETILAGLNLAEGIKDQGNSAKIILDPSFAGGGVIIKGEGTNFNFKDYTFKTLQSKLAIIDYYRNTPTIYIVNATGTSLPKTHPMVALKNAALWFVKTYIVNGTNTANKSGIGIIDYTNGTMNSTINRIKADLGGGSEIIVTTATPENGLKPVKGEHIGVYIYPEAVVATPTVITTP